LFQVTTKGGSALRPLSVGRFAFGQKIWHTIFFSSKTNFKIFPKLLPKLLPVIRHLAKLISGLTRRLADGARILQINMADHVIVGQPFDDRPGYFSFKEAGMI
jgi:hypothetical protein